VGTFNENQYNITYWNPQMKTKEGAMKHHNATDERGLARIIELHKGWEFEVWEATKMSQEDLDELISEVNS
jgi:hypothetical protein